MSELEDKLKVDASRITKYKDGVALEFDAIDGKLMVFISTQFKEPHQVVFQDATKQEHVVEFFSLQALMSTLGARPN